MSSSHAVLVSLFNNYIYIGRHNLTIYINKYIEFRPRRVRRLKVGTRLGAAAEYYYIYYTYRYYIMYMYDDVADCPLVSCSYGIIREGFFFILLLYSFAPAIF